MLSSISPGIFFPCHCKWEGDLCSKTCSSNNVFLYLTIWKKKHISWCVPEVCSFQVIAERLSVKMGNLRRGDIVGCLAPHEPNQLLCKRLTRMEYDTVYNCGPPWNRVPKGHVFLEGDNAGLSTDSRMFGPVPQGLVQIRLVFRIWPLSRAGWLSNHWFWESNE